MHDINAAYLQAGSDHCLPSDEAFGDMVHFEPLHPSLEPLHPSPEPAAKTPDYKLSEIESIVIVKIIGAYIL